MVWTGSVRGAVVAAMLFAAPQVAAHHSTAEFDYSKTVILQGTIKELQWTNPHSYVQVMVPKPDGSVEQWGVEIGAPAINIEMGWRRNSVKSGDKVTLNIAPARNGRTFGTLRHMTFEDGHTLDGVAARVSTGPSGSIAD